MNLTSSSNKSSSANPLIFQQSLDTQSKPDIAKANLNCSSRLSMKNATWCSLQSSVPDPSETTASLGPSGTQLKELDKQEVFQFNSNPSHLCESFGIHPSILELFQVRITPVGIPIPSRTISKLSFGSVSIYENTVLCLEEYDPVTIQVVPTSFFDHYLQVRSSFFHLLYFKN